MNVTNSGIDGNRNNCTEYSPFFIADLRSIPLTVPIVNFQPPAGDGYKYKLSPRSELLSFLQQHHPLLKHTFLHHIHLHNFETPHLLNLTFAGRIPTHPTPSHTFPPTSSIKMPRTKMVITKSRPALRSAPIPGAGVVRKSKRKSSDHPFILQHC